MTRPDADPAPAVSYVLGHSEDEIDRLRTQRMHEEAVRTDSVVVGHLQVGAWCRV